ncbi:MAG: hypothetical protein IJ598_04455 [Ruminococcus sp.]|nr:hypothetical protein [Ruminococcus sp.]
MKGAFGKVSFLSFTLQSRRQSGATAPLKGSLFGSTAPMLVGMTAKGKGRLLFDHVILKERVSVAPYGNVEGGSICLKYTNKRAKFWQCTKL